MSRARGRARTRRRACSSRMTRCVKRRVKKQYRVGAMNAMTYGGQDLRPARVHEPDHADRQQERVRLRGVADQRRADDELEAAARDGEEARQVRRQRQPHPHRLRPEDRSSSVPAVGQVVRRRHHLEGRPPRPAEHPQAVAALAFTTAADQRAGRLEQVQVVPRHVGLLRRAATRSSRISSAFWPMESFIYNTFSQQLAERRSRRQVLHEPQGRPDHVLQRQRVGRSRRARRTSPTPART